MTTLPGWTLTYQGKVRDIYIPENESSDSPSLLLMVATNRVSAHDVILSPEIPGKGATLTEVSAWWMHQFPEIPNHLLNGTVPAAVHGRAVLAKPLDMLPVECVVRGYLVGSGWTEYSATQTVCGVELPGGLAEGDQLPEPIFTPATKAAVGDHDINIDFDTVVDMLGEEQADTLRSLSIRIYRRAAEIAYARGLILADTKFEFGVDSQGVVVWADEALTPDSSRYWDVERYLAGGADRLGSFDKQPVRDWLSANWSGDGPPPELPADVIADTQKRYSSLRDRLVGGTP